VRSKVEKDFGGVALLKKQLSGGSPTGRIGEQGREFSLGAIEF
jgi:hypothetical protein